MCGRGKSKGKVHPRRPRRPIGGDCSSTLSLTSALDGVGGQCHAPAALPPGKTRYPPYKRLGGSQGRCGWVRKIAPQPGLDPRTVQPVASRYTDRAIPAHMCCRGAAESGKRCFPDKTRTNVSNLFWNDILHVSEGLSIHHKEFKTVHTATGICQTDTSWYPLASRQQYLFDIYLLVYFDVLLTVHLSIFISVFNQLDVQKLCHIKFYFMPLHVVAISCTRRPPISVMIPEAV